MNTKAKECTNDGANVQRSVGLNELCAQTSGRSLEVGLQDLENKKTFDFVKRLRTVKQIRSLMPNDEMELGGMKLIRSLDDCKSALTMSTKLIN